MHCIYWPEINTIALIPVPGNPLLTHRMNNENLNRYDSQFNETTKTFNFYGIIRSAQVLCSKSLLYSKNVFL